MPYHIEKAGNDFEVLDDAGKVVGKHPSRKLATDQLRALYANVPEAGKKESEVTDKATADINDLPDSAFLLVESGGSKDEGGKTVPRSLRHLPYKTADGAIDLPKLRNALSRLGQPATGESGGEKWLTAETRDRLRAKAEKILADNTDAASAKPEKKEAKQPDLLDRLIGFISGNKEQAAYKGDVPGHEFHGNQYSEGGGGGNTGESDEGAGYRQPSDFKGAENQKVAKTLSEADKHLQAAKSEAAKIPENKRREFSYIQSTNHARDAEAIISSAIHSAAMGKRGIQQDQADKALQWSKESLRLLSFVTKEGKRNAGADQDRLQQIHDLAVANGANCMFSVKEVNGAYRWVMLSSNAFLDTDREIVSQKALEADVARTDKETGGDYGPLRWWHMGDPDPVARVPGAGIDIGNCDFRAMQGRTLIESGSINDKRIGLALKNKADDLAASIGFFHPLNEPDGEGVYNTIHVFERSVLPRAKASNQLTALTVTGKGDHDMATMKEKWSEFVTMLGGDETMARSVVKQAQETEDKADQAGLKFKEGETAAPPVVADKAAKKGMEGSPEEETTEPKKEAAEEGDEETPKDFEKKVGAIVKKEIDAALAAQRKEMTEKEAGLEAQITALDAKLKEAQAVIVTLAGDLPRGVKAGYRASVAPETVTTKEAPNAPKPDPLGEMYNWMTQSLGSHSG